MNTHEHTSPMERMLPEPKKLVALTEWELNRLACHLNEDIYWNFDKATDEKLGKLLAKLEKARAK